MVEMEIAKEIGTILEIMFCVSLAFLFGKTWTQALWIFLASQISIGVVNGIFLYINDEMKKKKETK